MLDALVDRQDGHIAGAAEASGVEHRLQPAEHARRAIGRHQDPVDEIRTRQVKGLFGDRPAVMLKQTGVVAEDAFDPSNSAFGHAAYWSHGFTSQPAILLRAACAHGASARLAVLLTEAGNSNSSTTASATAFSTSSSIG